MKTCKRLLSLLAAALFAACCLALPAAADGSAAANVRNSVVMILFYAEDDTGYVANQGTGFFVGSEGENPQYIVTNYHVIENYVTLGGGTKDAYPNMFLYAFYDSNEYEELYIVDHDESKDIAILRLNEPTNKRVPVTLREPTDDLIGQTAYAVGYPGVADAAIETLSSYNVEDATVTTGNISRLLSEQGTGCRFIQTDTEFSGGSSGGPLTDENGAVIGVTTASAVEADGAKVAGFGYAVSTVEILPLLDQNNVAYDMASGSSLPIVPLIVAAGVFVVVIICVIAASGSRKKKKAAVGAEPQPTPAPAFEPGPAGSPALRSLNMQHNGLRITVTTQGILIGRDPGACQLVYQQGTPGVSGRHCMVAYDAASGDFIVTDLNSSYGTYLMSGQRLTPNTPCHLRAGDSFYVGDRGNVLRTELG